NAERDIAKAEALAVKEANDAQVDSQTQIAIRNNELAIKRSELKVQEDVKKAQADAAYQIQAQEQMRVINMKTVEAVAAKEILTQERNKEINNKTIEAEIEKARKEQELTAERVQIKQNELEAQVQKQADADKYKKEIDARAELEQRKREAEAKAYEAEQEARAKIAIAEADKQEQMLHAEGIKALGDAEAYKIQRAGEAEAVAIAKKGLAEAEAMQKKAEAYEKYGQAAILDIMAHILPEVSRNVATPISAIDNLNVYGCSGQDAAGISGMVPTLIKQSMDTVTSATGVDMSEIIKANTYDAKVNKKVELDTDSKVDVTK
ncbi:MAG: hypothetical protein II525_00120, partial [Bacteroidales bacterium]|nr:hypothetical protein [Bacteroidales bacterium]